MLCRELLDSVREGFLPDWIGEGYYTMGDMAPECHGDVVEAALAAAGSAKAAEEHVADPVGHPNWIREDPDVVVGARGEGDMVTDWIQDKLYEIECTRQGKRPRRA